MRGEDHPSSGRPLGSFRVRHWLMAGRAFLTQRTALELVCQSSYFDRRISGLDRRFCSSSRVLPDLGHRPRAVFQEGAGSSRYRLLGRRERRAAERLRASSAYPPAADGETATPLSESSESESSERSRHGRYHQLAAFRRESAGFLQGFPAVFGGKPEGFFRALSIRLLGHGGWRPRDYAFAGFRARGAADGLLVCPLEEGFKGRGASRFARDSPGGRSSQRRSV